LPHPGLFKDKKLFAVNCADQSHQILLSAK
jgi:hypothetical protein